MSIDPRIILGIQPPPPMAARRQAQQTAAIQQQELEMRGQEIALRRQQLEQAGRPKPVAAMTPAERKTQIETNIVTAEALARLLTEANEANWPSIVAKATEMVGADAAASLGPVYPGPEAVQTHLRAGMSVKERLEQELRTVTEARAAQSAEALQRDRAADNVRQESVAAQAAKDRAIDDARADEQLKISRGQLAVAQQNANKPSGAGSGGSTTLSAGDQQLVRAILANPNIYANLTPTVKTRLAAALAEANFSGFAQAGGTKPPTGAQARALNFFNRAKQADTDVQSVEGQIAGMGLAGQAWNAVAPNVLQSGVGQLYTQSQRAFTEARLRKDSGAAIPPHEYENDKRTYFVQPGDTPATVAQKARARAAVLASLAYESGPALHGFYGDEADGMIADYRQAAGQKPAAAPAATAPTTKRNPFKK